MAPKSLNKVIKTVICSCKSSSRLASTSTSTASTSSTTIKSNTKILASSLISRSPLTLPPLHPLEKSYYNYQTKISRSISKPISTSTDWFFKSGSTAQKSFIEFDKKVEKETGNEVEGNEFELGLEGREEGGLEPGRGEKSLSSLERKEDRTVYLVIKENKSSEWQFPQGSINAEESLLDAAQRQLKEKLGENIDLWPTGRVPAGAFESTVSGSTTFFLPMRIVRGQASPATPNGKSSAIEFAWLTKEEIKEKVKVDYYAAVEDMLSEQ